MRKLFTSVVAALCLAAPVGTLSAQNTQQLTEAQKEAIKKEVLPVVFEQIKEQAGIDILGWANPKLSDTFAGIPVLESSNLRAASAEAVSVKPDSIVIDATKLGLPELALAFTTEKIKITFEDYDTKTLPISFGTTPITVELPAVINVNNGALASIYFDSTADGQTLLDLNVDATLLGSTEKMDLLSCSLTMDATANLNAQLNIEDGLTTIWNLFGNFKELPALPETDYLVTVGVGGLAMGSIRADLYAIPHNMTGARVPAGTAVVALDLQNTLMPIQKIDVTGYTSGNPTNYSVLYLDMTKTTASTSETSTLVIDNWKYGSETKTDSILTNKTFVVMTDNTPSIPTTPEVAVKSVVNRVVSELAEEGKATWYQLSIAQTQNKDITDAEDANAVVDIEVQPYYEDETTAIADVIITPANSKEYVVKATADLANNKIAVQVADYGTAYFTSNIAGVITANESVEESVATMKVVPVQNAIRVTNVDKATYRIVSMTGAVVASGHINGDTYISTASLSQGIYIVAVEANGTLQSVKVKL